MNEPLPVWVAWVMLILGLLFLIIIPVLLYRRKSRQQNDVTASPAYLVASCLKAYVHQDFETCVMAGRAVLTVDFISTVALLTIVSLRRLGRQEEADAFGRELLIHSFGPKGIFLLFMMILDGALNPERFLREQVFGGDRMEVTEELKCQVYFYWGVKLLMEGNLPEAGQILSNSVEILADIPEWTLAHADLQFVRALSQKTQTTRNPGE